MKCVSFSINRRLLLWILLFFISLNDCKRENYWWLWKKTPFVDVNDVDNILRIYVQKCTLPPLVLSASTRNLQTSTSRSVWRHCASWGARRLPAPLISGTRLRALLLHACHHSSVIFLVLRGDYQVQILKKRSVKRNEYVEE